MSKRKGNSYFLTVQMSMAEKEALDDAAEAAGVNRNHFVRLWIRSYMGMAEKKK